MKKLNDNFQSILNPKNKQTLCLMAIMLVVSFLHAKPAKNQVPEWVENCNKVYPRSEYIAMPGTGATAENAKSEATAALARYFSSNVKVNVDASQNYTEQNGEVQKTSALSTSIHTESNMEFFGIEHTEPFYSKTEKKWHSVAFINRAEAWEQFKPQVDIQKNEFSGLYKKLEKETDSFLKLKALKKTRQSANLLLEKLEYARLINPKEEADYQAERDIISELEVIAEEALSNCSICIQVTGSDYSKSIATAVSAAFSEKGFGISKTKGEAGYVAEVQIENNESGEEPISIKPAINLKLANLAGKTVYSHEILSEEKALGYTLETAQKKLYPKLSATLQKAIAEELEEFLR